MNVRDDGRKLGVYTLRFGFLPGRVADKDGTVTVGEGKDREKVPVVSATAYRARRQVEISKGRSLRKAMMDKGTILVRATV